MTDSSFYNMPAKAVTDKIIGHLVQAALLPESYISSMEELIFSGTSKPEDWKQLAEKIIEAELGGK